MLYRSFTPSFAPEMNTSNTGTFLSARTPQQYTQMPALQIPFAHHISQILPCLMFSVQAISNATVNAHAELIQTGTIISKGAELP